MPDSHPLNDACCSSTPAHPPKQDPLETAPPASDAASAPVLVEAEHVKRLLWVLGFNVAYGLTEWWGAMHTHSLALLGDAGHMAADASGVLLALLAALLSLLAQKNQRWEQAWNIERTATTLNAFALVLLALGLWQEGWHRLDSPMVVQGWPMLWIALGGLTVNWSSVRLFHHHQDNLNTRGAYLHMLSDLLGSVMACLSAILILTTHTMWFDTVASLVLALLVSGVALTFLRSAIKAWQTPYQSPSQLHECLGGGCLHQHG